MITLKLVLIPKPIGSRYFIMNTKVVQADSCEIPATIATLIIDSVTPEKSTEALLEWLKQAPKFVNEYTPYNLRIIL
jgi:hypothetical protein